MTKAVLWSMLSLLFYCIISTVILILIVNVQSWWSRSTVLLWSQWLPHDDLWQHVGRQAHEVSQPRSVAMERGCQDSQLVSLAAGHLSLLPMLQVAGRTKWRMHDIQVRLWFHILIYKARLCVCPFVPLLSQIIFVIFAQFCASITLWPQKVLF